jgi:Fur family ferric uptake transcriptional regulator
VERNTAQRQAVRRAFADAGRPLGPQEVLARATRHAPGIGIATVYRAIKALRGEHWLDEVLVPGDVPRYELARQQHHHHFSCRGCNRVYDVPGCVGHLDARVPPGFQVDSHEVMLFGTCQDCRSGAGAKRTRRRRR